MRSLPSTSFDDVTHAQIDPTSVCDLKCSYCVGRTWKPGHLSEHNFQSFVEQLPNLRYVQLQGEGEPMLGKRFWEHLGWLRASNIDVGFITNGRHLTEASVRRLLDLGVRTISISVDSMNGEEYRRLRGGDLNRVLRGVERLARLRPNRIDVFLTAVLTRRTFAALDDLRRYSDELGLSPPSCQELQQADAYVSAYRGVSIAADGLSAGQRQQMRAYLSWRATLRARRGLASYFESASNTAPSDSRCSFVETSLHLRYDGEVFPCCFIKESEHSLGNIQRDGEAISEVRHAQVSFRARIRRGETPPPCQGCHVLGPRHR
jgi:radical SAM protein with 4Fe4S-binding SPASM domain